MANELTREEWERRYAAQVMKESGLGGLGAIYVAKEAAEQFVYDERAAGNAIVWEDPEDAADEEMSYWENDGE